MDPASKLKIVSLSTLLIAGCFVVGYFLFAAPQQTPDPITPTATSPATSLKTTLDPPTKKYNVTIETTADWSWIMPISDNDETASFTLGGTPGLNNIDLTSDSSEPLARFQYSPTQITINQKPLGHAHITIKAVVETSRPILEVKSAHGDNGTILIRSPVDSYTNDQTTGDGLNTRTGALRLE